MSRFSSATANHSNDSASLSCPISPKRVPPRAAFDVIFCRNVLIYFEHKLKTKILNKIGQMMPHDGYLFLGGAETVIDLGSRFGTAAGERGIYTLCEETAH